MPEDLKIVAKYATAEEARAAKKLLDAAGIPAFLEGERMAGQTWYDPAASGGVSILVAKADSQRAVEVLAGMYRSSGSGADAAGQPGSEAAATPGAESGEKAPWGDVPLPWFTGFLLLFPPALVAYLLWKLIKQAGSYPLDDESAADNEPSPPDETIPPNT